MKRIALIEDDVALRRALATSLEKAGYEVCLLRSFENPLDDILAMEADLVLLDLSLPGQTGFDICHALKRQRTIPVLVLTALDGLDNELQALELGADDYLTKPCHPKRLIARIERLLQTYEGLHQTIRYDAVSLDLETNVMHYAEQELQFPETEAKILSVLLSKAPAVVSQDQLFKAVWGDSPYWDENLLQVNISRIRKNLESLGLAGALTTVRGKGYAWRPEQMDPEQIDPERMEER